MMGRFPARTPLRVRKRHRGSTEPKASSSKAGVRGRTLNLRGEECNGTSDLLGHPVYCPPQFPTPFGMTECMEHGLCNNDVRVQLDPASTSMGVICAFVTGHKRHYNNNSIQSSYSISYGRIQ
jgi:hypothetical protein